jgi:hypothetical protein
MEVRRQAVKVKWLSMKSAMILFSKSGLYCTPSPNNGMNLRVSCANASGSLSSLVVGDDFQMRARYFAACPGLPHAS